jgi:hypothetical protein
VDCEVEITESASLCAMTEEERLTKLRELDEKLKQLDDEKHRLFLLLKRVISVEDQKSKSLEEERQKQEEMLKR